MRNLFSTGASPSLLTLILVLFVTGCGQNGAAVKKLEAEKKELAAQIAELQNKEANQTVAGEGEAKPTSLEGDLEFKGKIAKSYEDSVEWWAKKQRPPENAPNVIIFLLDDTGFAQIGSFRWSGQHAKHRQARWRADCVTTISTRRPCARHRGRL